MTKATDLIRAAPKYLGVPYSKLDCQAFVEQCLKDAGITKNLPGSNAWYRTMTWVGTPKECKQKFGEIPPGAFLFILKPSGKEPEKYKPDGIGNASHIGIYTDESGMEMVREATEEGVINAIAYDFGDGAIHSSSSRGFVCTSRFEGMAINGGWNRIGLWAEIYYSDKVNRILEGKKWEGEKNDEEGEKMTAVVYATSGATVNLRKKPSTNSALVEQVPIGAEVTIESQEGDWSRVKYQNKEGYMLNAYLKEKGQPDTDIIQVKRETLERIYQEIGDILKNE